MTKQTKIILSVVISCSLLLALAIPSFASPSYYGTVVSPILSQSAFNDQFDNRDIFSYIGDGNTLTFNIEGTVSIDGETFSLDTMELLYQRNSADTGYEVVLRFLVVSEGQTELITYFNLLLADDTGWIYLPLGESFPVEFIITCDENTKILLQYFFPDSSFEEPYEGNPFTDIMNLIVDALDVPLFGTFSIWDMLTTICGLFAVVWLLKLLAGG